MCTVGQVFEDERMLFGVMAGFDGFDFFDECLQFADEFDWFDVFGFVEEITGKAECFTVNQLSRGGF